MTDLQYLRQSEKENIQSKKKVVTWRQRKHNSPTIRLVDVEKEEACDSERGITNIQFGRMGICVASTASETMPCQ
jgi:hypothetical protein